MAADKTWTYAELTAALERNIDINRRLAAKENEDGKRAYQLLADGALQLWNSVTTGWQDDGDRARLQALVDAIRPAEAN
ncbi:hypothetical protein [Cupriavidus necator]